MLLLGQLRLASCPSLSQPLRGLPPLWVFISWLLSLLFWKRHLFSVLLFPMSSVHLEERVSLFPRRPPQTTRRVSPRERLQGAVDTVEWADGAGCPRGPGPAAGQAWEINMQERGPYRKSKVIRSNQVVKCLPLVTSKNQRWSGAWSDGGGGGSSFLRFSLHKCAVEAQRRPVV